MRLAGSRRNFQNRRAADVDRVAARVGYAWGAGSWEVRVRVDQGLRELKVKPEGGVAEHFGSMGLARLAGRPSESPKSWSDMHMAALGQDRCNRHQVDAVRKGKSRSRPGRARTARTVGSAASSGASGADLRPNPTLPRGGVESAVGPRVVRAASPELGPLPKVGVEGARRPTMIPLCPARVLARTPRLGVGLLARESKPCGPSSGDIPGGRNSGREPGGATAIRTSDDDTRSPVNQKFARKRAK